MNILGWILVVLGIGSYVVALAILIKEQFAGSKKDLPAFETKDLAAIGDLIDKLGNAFEKFGKLSVPVQWALLGLANIGVGAYLINLP